MATWGSRSERSPSTRPETTYCASRRQATPRYDSRLRSAGTRQMGLLRCSWAQRSLRLPPCWSVEDYSWHRAARRRPNSRPSRRIRGRSSRVGGRPHRPGCQRHPHRTGGSRRSARRVSSRRHPRWRRISRRHPAGSHRLRRRLRPPSRLRLRRRGRLRPVDRPTAVPATVNDRHGRRRPTRRTDDLIVHRGRQLHCSESTLSSGASP